MNASKAILSNLFDGVTFPTKPVKIDKASTILNLRKFIDSHLTVIKANEGKALGYLFTNRLHLLKRILGNLQRKKTVLSTIYTHKIEYPQTSKKRTTFVHPAKRIDRYCNGFKKRTKKGELIFAELEKARKNLKK